MERPSCQKVNFSVSYNSFVNGNQKIISSSSGSDTSTNGTPSHSYKGSFSPSSPSSDELSVASDVHSRHQNHSPYADSVSQSKLISSTNSIMDSQQPTITKPVMNTGTIRNTYTSHNAQNNDDPARRISSFNQNLFQEKVYNQPPSLESISNLNQNIASISGPNANPTSSFSSPKFVSQSQSNFPTSSESSIISHLPKNSANNNANGLLNPSASIYSVSSTSATNFPVRNQSLSDMSKFPSCNYPVRKPTTDLSTHLPDAIDVSSCRLNEMKISDTYSSSSPGYSDILSSTQNPPSEPQKPLSQELTAQKFSVSALSQPSLLRNEQIIPLKPLGRPQSSVTVTSNMFVTPSQVSSKYQNVSLGTNSPQMKLPNPPQMQSSSQMYNNTISTHPIMSNVQGMSNVPNQHTSFPHLSKMDLPCTNNGPPNTNGFENTYGQPYASTTSTFANRYPVQQHANVQHVDFMSKQYAGLSATKHGYNALRGIETYDLLRMNVILPKEKTEAPRIQLPAESMSDSNCHPDVFRCTLTKIPETKSLLDKSRLPLGILLHPFRDLMHLSVIQCSTIVRCRSCRTYINPFVYFIDNRHWKCNLCFRANDLPDDFRYNPLTKMHDDPLRRPEVKNATIEFIASSEYMVRPPQRAIYLFILDVSRIATQTGYLSTVCEVLSYNLSKLPGDSRMSVGFIAVDSAVRFYELGENLNQPRELIVTDVDDIFIPHPENLLVNLHEQMELIRNLLELIPEKFKESYDTNCALGAALLAAHKLMAPTGGRVTVFISCLPNYGPGALKAREDPSQRGKSTNIHLNPATDFYKKLALDCSGVHVAVDLFIVNAQFVDLATISGISQISGGCMHHFPLYSYKNASDVEKLTKTFERYLTRKIGFEAVMRMRCTKGLSIHSFHGNFFVRTTDLLALPNVNPDAGFGMQVSIDENLSDLQTVCFQAALLYTSSKGERRIRVHTLCLPVTNNLHDILVSADQQCIAGLLAKMAVDRSLQTSIVDAREAFVNAVCDIFNSYKMVSSSGQPGTILAPKNLALFPLYILGLMKSIAFRLGVNTRTDDRVYSMYQMKCIPLDKLIQIIYPDLYPLHNLIEHPQHEVEGKVIALPPVLHLSAEHVDSTGAYLLDEGDSLMIFICHNLPPHICRNLFGYSQFNLIPDGLDTFPVIEMQENKLANAFIGYLQSKKPSPVILSIVKDTPQTRQKFFDRLIDDKGDIGVSYYEFLQTISSQMSH